MTELETEMFTEIMELRAENERLVEQLSRQIGKRKRLQAYSKELRQLNFDRIQEFCEKRMCVFSDAHHEQVNNLRCECRKWKERNTKLEKVAEAAIDVIDGCPYKGVLDFPELRAALDDWRNNDSI